MRVHRDASPKPFALVGIVVRGLIVRVSQQMKLLGECSGSIDSVRRLEHKLAEEESVPGFVNLNSNETQTAGEHAALGFREWYPKSLCDTGLH